MGPNKTRKKRSTHGLDLIAEAKELEAVDDVPHDGRVAEVARGCVQPRLAVVTAYLY